MTYPNHLPAERVGPGTVERPLVTEEGRVIVRGNCIEKVVQMPKSKRWAHVSRGGVYSAETWQYKEQAVDALRIKHGGGDDS